MAYWSYKPYVSVAQRRESALKAANKAKKKGEVYTPIAPYRGAIAKSFWGKAWCDNLEHYSDYENRLPRGRTYTRNGSVIDLKISAGTVQAKVMGSQLYTVSIRIAAVPQPHWQSVCTDCASSTASLIELLQGKLSQAVMARICTPRQGLFPVPKDMEFDCSCPDWADMCKHVAAVLYGVGARLDQQPELMFTLRHVDAQDLVQQATTVQPQMAPGKRSKKVMADADIADVFGLDMDMGMDGGMELGQGDPAKASKVKPAKTPALLPAKKSAKETASQTALKAVVKKAVKKTVAKKGAVKKVTSPASKTVVAPKKAKQPAAKTRRKTSTEKTSPSPRASQPLAKKAAPPAAKRVSRQEK